MRFERLLAIETSSAQLSLAVGNETRALKHYQSPLAWRHAETLMSAMRRLLFQARWPVQSLEGIVVSTGPGSFTGIRIGLAAARALGQALQIPVVGVSSLETMAYERSQRSEVRGKKEIKNTGRSSLLLPTSEFQKHFFVCPLIDALRGDVFTALFQSVPSGGFRRLWPDQRISRELLDQKLKGLDRKGQTVRKIEGACPDARMLLKIGVPFLVRAGKRSYCHVLPTYLRDAAAQERRKSLV